MGDGDAGLDAETLELAGLRREFGVRWHVYRATAPDGAVCWEAEVRPLRLHDRSVIRKATIPEMRAALEILDGRHR